MLAVVCFGSTVAPFAGAWIEILYLENEDGKIKSLPSRERGLKSLVDKASPTVDSRSLRGSVD